MKPINFTLRKLCVFMLLCSSIGVNAYDAYINGIYYNLNQQDKTAEVTCQYSNLENNYNFNGQADYNGKVVIPTSVVYNGITYKVEKIGVNAFTNSNLTSITIPNSIKTVVNHSFDKCDKLEKVIIPDIAAWCSVTIQNPSWTDSDVYSFNINYLYLFNDKTHLYKDDNTEITDLA